MNAKLKSELPLFLIMMVPAVFLLIKWNALPDELPIHWNAKGEVDDYGPKYMDIVMNLGIYLLLLVVPKIDPRKRNYDLFSGAYYKIRLTITLFFSVFTIVTIMIGLGYNIPMERFIAIGLALLFTVMGNYMSNIRPNFFVGIRTPWTLDNEEVWKRTHLVGGRLWFWGGLVCLISALLLPNKILLPVLLSVIGVISLVPIVYSFILFRRIKKMN